MNPNLKQVVLLCQNKAEAENYLYRLLSRYRDPHVIPVWDDQQIKLTVGLPHDDTPWLSMVRMWQGSHRVLYDALEQRFGPVWSEQAWVQSLKDAIAMDRSPQVHPTIASRIS